jgi:hypothetical protein
VARWNETFIPLLTQIGASIDALFGSFARAAPSANPTADQDNLSTTADNQVTGLTATESLGVVRATWNPVSLTAITRYDLQLATDADFTQGLESVSTQDPHGQIGDQTPGEGYFLRVRVVDGSGNPGPFSPAVTVNLAPVETPDIETAAVDTNQVASEAMLAYAETGFFAFTELSLTGTTTEDYDGHEVLFPDTSTRTVIEIDYEYQADVVSSTASGLVTVTASLLRYPFGLTVTQADIVDEIVIDLTANTVPGSGSYASGILHFRFLSDPIPPEGPGEYTYVLRLSIAGSGGTEVISLIGTQLFITSFTHKR